VKNEFRCLWMDKQIIRQRADGVRVTYLPNGNIPIDSQYIAEFGLRLDIDPLRGLFAEFEIDAWLKPDLSGMVVDLDRYMNERFNNRLRFSFAHELGHYFLHRNLLKILHFASFSEWKEFILTLPEKEYKYFEWQANEFAGRLVVPLAELNFHLSAACEKIKEDDSLTQILAKDPGLVLSAISPTLCRPFGVSDEVIETRVEREGLWPPTSNFPDLFKDYH
jgi:hypothetical protein